MAGRQERQKQAAREAFAARAGSPATPEAVTPAGGAPGAAPGSRSGATAVPAPDAPVVERPGAAPVEVDAPSTPRRGLRRRTATSAAPAAPEPAQPTKEGGKGRPTPKRREAEAANRRPVVVTDRKAARKKERAAREAAYQRQQEGIARGDERYFLPRDRGAARGYVRDLIDARWNIGELMLPVAVVVLLVMFLQALIPDVVAVIILVTYFVLLAGIVDSAFAGWLTKRKAVRKFGADQVPDWTAWYGAMRALQVRRLRQPKPRVRRGATID